MSVGKVCACFTGACCLVVPSPQQGLGAHIPKHNELNMINWYKVLSVSCPGGYAVAVLCSSWSPTSGTVRMQKHVQMHDHINSTLMLISVCGWLTNQC